MKSEGGILHLASSCFGEDGYNEEAGKAEEAIVTAIDTTCELQIVKRTLVGLLIGFIVGIILLPVCAFFYIRFGYAPVATAGPPLPLEKRLASMALKARIKREAPKEVPVSPTEENLMAGAKVYRKFCAVCHGMSGQPKTATANGMYPPPPQLLHGKGVTDDPVGETYWKVANGIRLTGMPAYKGSLSDLQSWQVSQLLANANHLPGTVSQFLASEPPAQ